MVPLPWKRFRPLEEASLVSVTELRLRRWRDVPGLAIDALRLRRALRNHGEAVAVSLAAAPLQRTFWTLSLWPHEAALVEYFRGAEHAQVMRRYRAKLERSGSARWPVEGPGIPRWVDAVHRLADGQ